MSDVARIAGGFHPSTVSLALRNDPSIPEATRRLVKKAARKIGYRPDPLLDAFNSHRKGMLPHKSVPVIAFVADCDSREQLEASPLHGELLKGARESARLLHCKLEIFLCGRSQLSPERINGILEARGIVAVIVAAFRPQTRRFGLEWKNFCAVLIESPHLAETLSFIVRSDQREAARLALLRLAALGFRHVGLALTADESSGSSELHRVGFQLEQARMEEAGRIPILDLPIGARAAPSLARWVKKHRVDAIITDMPDLRSLLAFSGEASARAPAFASLDVSGSPAEVAGIVPDHPRVGAQAVDQVVGLMRANQRGLSATQSCTYIPVSWRDGNSASAR
jgi:LacI family transcriptional regulator